MLLVLLLVLCSCYIKIIQNIAKQKKESDEVRYWYWVCTDLNSMGQHYKSIIKMHMLAGWQGGSM